ncbi:major facilitator superfamily domain-containing protein [Cryomyces antarcticus]
MPEQFELHPTSTTDFSSGATSNTSQAYAMPQDSLNTENASEQLSHDQVLLNRRTVRKFDLILLPFLSLLFLLNSLDRSNIGNAETANFTRDAGLAPQDLNTAVACFFAFFVALQPIGAALGRRYGMALWVPACMSIWGLCTALHIWVHAKWQLITLRIVIGILEAGFYPVTVSYLSLFYTRFEFARRLGLFYGQYAVAGALGGVLSYVVFSKFPNLDTTPEDGKWKSWQILFLLEGGSTIVVALVGFFWLPHSAESAWFLDKEERRWAEARITRDRSASEITQPVTANHEDEDGSHVEEALRSQPISEVPEEAHGLLTEGPVDGHRLDRKFSSATAISFTQDTGLSHYDVLSAFTDWKIYFLLFVNILSAIPAMAFSVFLPLVVKGLGFDSVHANLLTAPPFMTGVVILWLFTWWSDKRRERLIPILYGLAILLAGLTATVMLPKDAYRLRYAALCVLLGGCFIASPLTVAWLTGNIPEPGKRAIVLGINGWGNLAGLFSALLFKPQYAPEYVTPFFVTLTCVMVSFVGYMIFRLFLLWENAARSRTLAKWSAEDVERERVCGTGPVVRARATMILRRALKLERWIGDGVDARRGDEKMTFQYGL